MAMSISTQPYKGARDFYPEDMRQRKWMFEQWRTVCERFGYEEYDAPIIEPTELYLSKGSDEIVNEQTYSFTDRGGRNVTIRTEMTPTVSRMVAGRAQELAYPVRWYSMPNLWRYERPQRGRGREFYQLNVDIFGVAGLAAEHECLQIVDSIMKQFGAKQDSYQIKLNSRKLVNAILGDYLGLDAVQSTTIIRLIDRMKKMQPEEFKELIRNTLTPSQREAGVFEKLLATMRANTLDQLPPELQQLPSVVEMKILMGLCADSGITNVVFDITLMRGFDYYTDIVFEVFDTDPENNRSMFGGGRYDGLVALFGVEPIPVVGFAMGDITLQNFLTSHGLLPKLQTEADLYVIMIGDVYPQAQRVIKQMRDEKVNVFVDTSGRKPEKQLKNAIKKGVDYVLFIGDQEVKNEQYKLKNLGSQQEQEMSIERVITSVLGSRRQQSSSLVD